METLIQLFKQLLLNFQLEVYNQHGCWWKLQWLSLSNNVCLWRNKEKQSSVTKKSSADQRTKVRTGVGVLLHLKNHTCSNKPHKRTARESLKFFFQTAERRRERWERIIPLPDERLSFSIDTAHAHFFIVPFMIQSYFSRDGAVCVCDGKRINSGGKRCDTKARQRQTDASFEKTCPICSSSFRFTSLMWPHLSFHCLPLRKTDILRKIKTTTKNCLTQHQWLKVNHFLQPQCGNLLQSGFVQGGGKTSLLCSLFIVLPSSRVQPWGSSHLAV